VGPNISRKFDETMHTLPSEALEGMFNPEDFHPDLHVEELHCQDWAQARRHITLAPVILSEANQLTIHCDSTGVAKTCRHGEKRIQI